MGTIRKKIFVNWSYLLILMTAVFATGCSRDSDPEPAKDPVVNGYSPETARGGSELTIQGDHFGDDIANVKVWINGLQAKVVSVSPTRIYVTVPPAVGSGAIKVAVGDKEFDLASPFTFEYTRNVSTYSGSGTNLRVDGALRQASFNRPYWLAYDKKDDALFVLENDRAVRRIKNGQVETVALLTGIINNPRNITMSVTCDTLFIGNDNSGNFNNANVAILTRDSDFKVQKNYVNATTGSMNHVNYAGVHPDGTLIFYCWARKLYKYNKANNRVELLYDLASAAGPTESSYANFNFSPDGRTIYVVFKYPFMGILKADYNPATHQIVGAFTRFTGTGTAGFADGQGLTASFDEPAQLTVDSYGRLFIAERFNHWIRMVTPSGQVSRYAGDGGGRGSFGFADGSMLTAKFDLPEGIAIDKDGNIYVAELANGRIRVIKEE